MPKKSWKILGNVSNKFYQNLEHSYTILISSKLVMKKIEKCCRKISLKKFKPWKYMLNFLSGIFYAEFESTIIFLHTAVLMKHLFIVAISILHLLLIIIQLVKNPQGLDKVCQNVFSK